METTADLSRFSQTPVIIHHSLAGRRLAVVMFCWKGKAHVEMGSECQDFADAYLSSDSADADQLTLVVADGVSTRSRSRKGAEFACQALGRTLSDSVADGTRLSDCFDRGRGEFIKLCATDARQCNSEDDEATGPSAVAENEGVIEYATTALALCLNKKGYWAASVGDGAIYGVAAGGTKAHLLTKINREGFANEVRPLTNDQWQRSFDESDADFVLDDTLEGFCLMTDGLSESIGDAGIYFGSVWPELKQRLDDQASLTEYAEAFCRYWEDRKFSDDDKTLVAVFLNP